MDFKSIIFILSLIFSTSAISKEKKIFSMSGSYISPKQGLSWEIKNVYISSGMYQIKVNKENFPKSLSDSDTLYMPSWIAEQELLDNEGNDFSYIFIVEEKKNKE